MKKVKMRVTCVIVIFIVGSAFAFNAKKVALWCVTNSTIGTPPSCYTAGPLKRTTGVGITLRYYPFSAWDGTAAICNAGGANSCTIIGTFTMD